MFLMFAKEISFVKDIICRQHPQSLIHFFPSYKISINAQFEIV